MNTPFYALVIDSKICPTKTGGFYLSIQLKTMNGIVKANIWQVSPDAEKDPNMPNVGGVICVESMTENTSYGSITIKKFSKIKREEIPEECAELVEMEKATSEQMDESISLILDSSFWENKTHHDFVMKCIKKVGLDKFKLCPAATRVHHRYAGGLIVHTAEVLRICKGIYEACSQYSFLNRDVLYAGAILHDLGKVYTYFINDIGVSESRPTEKTLGHIFYSAYVTQLVLAENAGMVDRWFADEVLHCIAAHHGEPEYGAVKKPYTLEAGILYRADYISAKNGMIHNVLKEVQPSEPIFNSHGDMFLKTETMQKYMEQQS